MYQEYELERFTHNGLRIRIIADTDASNPREDFDQFGVMTCFHSRYTLGDKHNHASPENFLENLLPEQAVERLERFATKLWQGYDREIDEGNTTLEKALTAHSTEVAARRWIEVDKVAIMLPLYLYDHSGITMRVSPFSCPWDSGQVGWIFATLESIRAEFGVKRVTAKIRERVTKMLTSEVAEYDQYLTGDVWGYVIDAKDNIDDEGDEYVDVGSCWGFFGSDYCKEAALEEADAIERERLPLMASAGLLDDQPTENQPEI